MLHCNGIDLFVTLMGNFNWGPISRNDIVSSISPAHRLDKMNVRLKYPKNIFKGLGYIEECEHEKLMNRWTDRRESQAVGRPEGRALQRNTSCLDRHIQHYAIKFFTCGRNMHNPTGVGRGGRGATRSPEPLSLPRHALNPFLDYIWRKTYPIINKKEF